MKTFVWAFVGAVAVMGAASAAPAPDCHEEVNAPGDLATTMLAIKVGEAIREQYEVLFADPTGDTAALWIAAAIKAVEPVTKRKSGVTVRRYAADQAENVLKLAPATNRKRESIRLLK